MKQIFILLTLALSSQSFAQLVQLNTSQFEIEFNLLQKQKGYNSQIKSNGYIHEKFLVTGKSIIDERESVKMTGYYKADDGRDKMYSISEYRVAMFLHSWTLKQTVKWLYWPMRVIMPLTMKIPLHETVSLVKSSKTPANMPHLNDLTHAVLNQLSTAKYEIDTSKKT